MRPHDFLDDDLRERAALYVLGSLPEDEERAWRLHLPTCAACRAEVRSLERVAGELIGLAPAVEPPPALWNRVLARVRQLPRVPSESAAREEVDDPASGQIWKRWASNTSGAPALAYVLGGEEFEATGIAGISARKLFVDPPNDRVTMLVRMQPGSSYPAHRHAGPEDCFVLEGDLDTGERRLRAGDYVRASEGSVHDVQSTAGGCLLLIVSSLGDELVA